MSQRLEIWTIAQKWMTMDENVKKEVKNKKKGREKDEENKKDENKKNKLNYQ